MNPDAPCNCVPEKIRLLISDVDGTLITPEKTLTVRHLRGCQPPL